MAYLMLFGQYRDQPITDVPSGYLFWLLRNGLGGLDPDVEHHVDRELNKRLKGRRRAHHYPDLKGGAAILFRSKKRARKTTL